MDAPDHILIVDDDAEIRSLLTKYLVKNGLRVTAVGDGRAMAQALDAVAQGKVWQSWYAYQLNTTLPLFINKGLWNCAADGVLGSSTAPTVCPPLDFTKVTSIEIYLYDYTLPRNLTISAVRLGPG